MAKKMNWEKNRKNQQVRDSRRLETLHRVHEDAQDMMVKAFFNFVEYHKANNLPAPEFDVNEWHKWC